MKIITDLIIKMLEVAPRERRVSRNRNRRIQVRNGNGRASREARE